MFGALLFAFSLLVVPGQDWTAVIGRVEPGVLVLHGIDDGEPFICSATVVAKDLVLTAGHCIPRDGSAVEVGGRHAEVVRANPVLDLALLAGSFPGPAVQIRPAEIRKGEVVALVGYGLGGPDPRWCFGRVSDVRGGVGPFTDRIWLDLTVVAGQSGGAVIDVDGHLVTIIQMRVGGNGYLAAGALPESLREFVLTYTGEAKKK
jgi:S1-C subfamily serine protease